MAGSIGGPRARLLDYGAGALDTQELLSILLRGAEMDPDLVVEVSDWIDTGSPETVGMGLGTYGELCREHAVVLAATLELARRVSQAPAPALVRGPADVALIAQRKIGGRRRERVVVVVCDSANRLLRTVVVSEGAIDRSMIPVREILNAVLRWDGSTFAVAHNHPRGDSEPSDSDVDATRRIGEAARVVGLRFLGHVVVGDGGWVAVST